MLRMPANNLLFRKRFRGVAIAGAFGFKRWRSFDLSNMSFTRSLARYHLIRMMNSINLIVAQSYTLHWIIFCSVLHSILDGIIFRSLIGSSYIITASFIVVRNHLSNTVDIVPLLKP